MRSFFLIFVCWAALFLPGLGETELKGEEGRRILPAREMLRTGEFVVPFSEGRPYHRKPPGLNWCIAGLVGLTGQENAWIARLPSVLAVLLLAGACLKYGDSLLGQGGGLALALAHLTVAGLLEKARLAELEALYIAFVGIGFLGWLAAWQRNASPWRLWLVTIVPFALAQLVKGPVFMAFFYSIVLAMCFRHKKWSAVVHPAHWVCLAASLAPLVGWGWLVKQRMVGYEAYGVTLDGAQPAAAATTAAATPSGVWLQQITERLSFGKIDWAEWAALPVRSLVLFAPWLVWGLWLWVRKSRQPAVATATQSPWMQGLFWGSLLSALGFCLLPATRARYLLPLLTPLLIWAVAVLRASYGEDARLGRVGRRVVIGLASLLAVAGVGLGFTLPLPMKLACVGVVVGFLLVIVKLFRRDVPQTVFLMPALLASMAVGIAACTIIPLSRQHENVRPLAEKLLTAIDTPGSIVAFNPGPQPMLFYLGQRCVEASRVNQMPEDAAYVLIQPRDWEGDFLGPKLRERGFTQELMRVTDERAARQRDYLLIKKVMP